MASRTVIAVIIERSFGSFRDILRGINRFSRATGDWHLEFLSPVEDYVQRISEMKPRGMIMGWVGSKRDANRAIKLVPKAVGVCAQLERLNIRTLPQIESDDEGVGEMAARHFLDRGYRNFAFVGSVYLWSHRRWLGFERVVKQAGFNVSLQVFEEGESTADISGIRRPHYQADMAAWLQAQPKPLAVLACCDRRSLDVSNACRDEGIRVPDDIAILGVDDDDLDCELSHPPLSSVRVPWQRIGEEAASMLKRLLDKEKIPPKVYGVPPVSVIERQSTDTLAISDPELSAAIRFIREHAQDDIGVEDIMRDVAISRRSMESRFRKHLGRSPLDEIRRVRIELAKQLLAGTEMPMPAIAERCGFNDAARFSRVFHSTAGMAPTQYRSLFRR